MIDYEKFWEEVSEKVKDYVVENKQSHEKSPQELSQMWGLSRKDTTNMIVRLLEDGTFQTRKAKAGNGKIIDVYYPSETGG